MKILVTGGHGQLGRALTRKGATPLDEHELDITDPTAIARTLDAHAPTTLVNAAAYTAVDKAESERDKAFAVNAQGAANLAAACATRGITLLHVSTDYVFDGTATRPYREDDAISPQSVYGDSKAHGERAVLEQQGTVVRTSWLFEEKGPSFVHTMLRLAQERPLLRVVDDQRGCPTWADDLADALVSLAHLDRRQPIYHYCNDGVITWHGFASAIIDEARQYRPMRCERIEAITTAEYPTPARRPAYSVLDTSRIRSEGIRTPPWTIGLAHVVAQVLRS